MPKRDDWLPNRMFDPVNNPFAIQNLLAREREKEDAVFHVEADGRPASDYKGNALLRDKHSLPPKDFSKNPLLDDVAAERAEFRAEYDDTEARDATVMDELPVAASSSSMIDMPENEVSVQGQVLVATGGDVLAVAGSETEADPVTVNSTPEQPAPAAEAAWPAEEHDAADAVTDTVQAADIRQDDHKADPLLGSDNAIVEPARSASDHESLPETALPAAAADADSMTETTLAEQDGEPYPTVEPVESTAESGAESVAELPLQSASEVSSEVPLEASLEASSEASPQQDAGSGTAEPHPAEAPAEPALDSEAIDRLLQAAREEAREQAYEEALALGRQQAREVAYQEGLEAGIAQAKAELQQEIDEQRTQLTQLITGLQKLSEDPDALFEPMKKLAVHLAEQLVRGELTQSPQTISRLVDNCLRELAASGEKAVIVHLNPEDLEQYRPLIASFGDSIVLRPDALLARGSVRASLDGSVVEDLIDRRVKGISKSLAQPIAGGWRPAAANPVLQRSPSQPAKKAPAVSSEIPDPVDAAEGAMPEFADEALVPDESGVSVAEASGEMFSAALAGDEPPAEADNSRAP